MRTRFNESRLMRSKVILRDTNRQMPNRRVKAELARHFKLIHAMYIVTNQGYSQKKDIKPLRIQITNTNVEKQIITSNYKLLKFLKELCLN